MMSYSHKHDKEQSLIMPHYDHFVIWEMFYLFYYQLEIEDEDEDEELNLPCPLVPPPICCNVA